MLTLLAGRLSRRRGVTRHRSDAKTTLPIDKVSVLFDDRRKRFAFFWFGRLVIIRLLAASRWDQMNALWPGCIPDLIGTHLHFSRHGEERRGVWFDNDDVHLDSRRSPAAHTRRHGRLHSKSHVCKDSEATATEMLNMLWLTYISLLATILTSASPLATTPSLEEIAERYTRRTAGGVHLPIVRTTASERRRRGLASAIGLGDFEDIFYDVLISIGGTTAPLLLDTGSSDLWIMSDKCSEGCTPGEAAYPQASFQYSGVDADLIYGDSTSGTFASGMIGQDVVSLAGLTLPDQYFIAVNCTNTTFGKYGLSGIFGLGFPVISVVSGDLWIQSRASNTTRREVTTEDIPISPSNVKYGSRIFPSFDFRRNKFLNLPGFFNTFLRGKRARQTGGDPSSLAASLIASWPVFGPFLSRFVIASQLTLPMFSVTLQRDSIQIGGNVGMLSIGELPYGISNHSLTWVPIRVYPFSQGGLPAPTGSLNEVYPLGWEVPLDDVYFDGVKLPRSNLSSSSISLSALVDTGNSILRGPADVVQQIQTKLGNNGRFPCSEPHTIAFSIGGKLFPVDPRDFIYPVSDNNVETCGARLVATDPPSTNGTQISWSLGDPFLKSVLAAFYYGNVTYPSQDPPRMGFLSTVPPDAASKLASAVAAVKSGNTFPIISEAAPSGTFKPAGTASNGVPVATATGPLAATGSTYL